MHSSFNFSQSPLREYNTTQPPPPPHTHTPHSLNKGTQACAWNKLTNQRQLGRRWALDCRWADLVKTSPSERRSSELLTSWFFTRRRCSLYLFHFCRCHMRKHLGGISAESRSPALLIILCIKVFRPSQRKPWVTPAFAPTLQDKNVSLVCFFFFFHK